MKETILVYICDIFMIGIFIKNRWLERNNINRFGGIYHRSFTEIADEKIYYPILPLNDFFYFFT